MTAPRHVDVGAYVLGILDEPDEAAYEQHFAQCEQCRREFIELADLPAILDTLKPPKKQAERPAPTLPPLDTLIDFKQLSPPGQAPAVPPQQRPAGATQPQRRPHFGPTRTPTNGRPAASPPRTNGTARPPAAGPTGTGRHLPATPPKPGPEGTGRHAPAAPPNAGARPQVNGTGRHLPATPPKPGPEGTGRHTPAAPPNPGTGRHAPVAPPKSGTHSTAEGTGRHTPAAPPKPGARAEGPAAGSRPAPASKAPAKPPSKPRDTGPAGRAGARRPRKPVWVAAAAVVAVALSVGVVIGVTSGGGSGDGNQVADRNTSAPTTPPSGSVAGAHAVSGTDPETGVTAIITIEPVTDGTEIDLRLFEVDGPQEGVLVAVSRFGDREVVANWQVPADQGEGVRASGVAPLAQQDIIRFEVHGDGIEPLLVVPT